MTEQKSLEQIIMEAIDFCTHTRCKKCEYYGKDSAYDYKGKCRGRMMADHLIANGVTFATDNNVGGKWIPATERLPEPFEDVLVYDSTAKRIEFAYMTRHKEWVGVVIKNDVTHWMPLPEPPKEGE